MRNGTVTKKVPPLIWTLRKSASSIAELSLSWVSHQTPYLPPACSLPHHKTTCVTTDFLTAPSTQGRNKRESQGLITSQLVQSYHSHLSSVRKLKWVTKGVHTTVTGAQHPPGEPPSLLVYHMCMVNLDRDVVLN